MRLYEYNPTKLEISTSVDSALKRRELRRKHAQNPEIPRGPACPRCQSSSYLICRGRILQFKCVEFGHDFTELNSK